MQQIFYMQQMFSVIFEHVLRHIDFEIMYDTVLNLELHSTYYGIYFLINL